MMTGSFLSNFSILQAQLHEFEPWSGLFFFLVASWLMIWRLEAIERKGLAGTVLGTVVMPYCSGLSNLIFAFILGSSGGLSSYVLENCIINNVTNLTLLMGLPALFWPLAIFPNLKEKKQKSKPNQAHRLNYLSLLLTIIALLFFTSVLWALGKDGILNWGDGLVLVGLFLFWQTFQIFEVLKQNVQKNQTLPWSLILDAIIILACGYATFKSINSLVDWLTISRSGFFQINNLGWLSGFLMVLPNGLLAFYYAKKLRTDVVISSQIGDAHICIPMCIGIYSLFYPIKIPHFFNLGIIMILAGGTLHLIVLMALKRVPRWIGFSLTVAYIYFLFSGLSVA